MFFFFGEKPGQNMIFENFGIKRWFWEFYGSKCNFGGKSRSKYDFWYYLALEHDFGNFSGQNAIMTSLWPIYKYEKIPWHNANMTKHGLKYEHARKHDGILLINS